MAKQLTLDELTRKLKVVKRDGREEAWSKKKIMKLAMFVSDWNEVIAEDLIHSSIVKIRGDKIDIKDMYDSILDTAINKISRLTPKYDFVASKLLLLKLYREAYNIKNKTYSPLDDVLKKGIESKRLSRKIYNEFTKEQIDELSDYIVQERDYFFTWNALNSFNRKYCKMYSKTKKLELPQHTYMRVAMGLTYNLKDIEFTKKIYDLLSLHLITLGSPHMIGAFTDSYQGASCVLSTMGNDTWDIMNKLTTAGLYTKASGGLAFDITLIQAKGGLTNRGVECSGIVPYIQNLQQVIKSMVQAEERRGMAVITCQWWHYEIEDFLVLKDNGGTHETRAEALKYALATNNYFLDAVAENREVVLFDPKDAEALYYAKDDQEFEEEYEKLLNRKGIRYKKVNAKDLYHLYIKNYFQTGNVYETRLSNINPNMTGRKVNSSNLCQEITEPSVPGELVKESIITEDGEEFFVTKFKNEEIALCNLASYNLKIFLPEYREKYDLEDIFYMTHKLLDNTIDIGYYPRASAKKSNLDNRFIGLGVSNYTYYLASKGIKFSDKEALDETFKLFQEINYLEYKSNIRLAKELGTPKNFDKSLYKKGKHVYDLGNKDLKEKFGHLFNEKWYNEIKEGILQDGLRNILMTAIAPTASSGSSIGVIESIEPILDFSYELDGSVSGTVLVPEVQKLGKYYEPAFTIDPVRIVLLAAIRQLWIDQSQSVNLYIREENWNYQYIEKLLLLANKLGVKTSYYLTSKKQNANDVCESCSS